MDMNSNMGIPSPLHDAELTEASSCSLPNAVIQDPVKNLLAGYPVGNKHLETEEELEEMKADLLEIKSRVLNLSAKLSKARKAKEEAEIAKAEAKKEAMALQAKLSEIEVAMKDLRAQVEEFKVTPEFRKTLVNAAPGWYKKDCISCKQMVPKLVPELDLINRREDLAETSRPGDEERLSTMGPESMHVEETASCPSADEATPEKYSRDNKMTRLSVSGRDCNDMPSIVGANYPGIYLRNNKRMRFSGNGRDCNDMPFPGQKQQESASRVFEFSNPVSLETFDISQCGSLSDKIKALIGRKKRLRSSLYEASTLSHLLPCSPKQQNKSVSVELRHRGENLRMPQNIIVLDDDSDLDDKREQLKLGQTEEALKDLSEEAANKEQLKALEIKHQEEMVRMHQHIIILDNDSDLNNRPEQLNLVQTETFKDSSEEAAKKEQTRMHQDIVILDDDSDLNDRLEQLNSVQTEAIKDSSKEAATTTCHDLNGVSDDPIKTDETVPLAGVVSDVKDGAEWNLSSQHQQNSLDHDLIGTAKTMHNDLIGVSDDPAKIDEAVPLPSVISDDNDGEGWKLSSQYQWNSLKDHDLIGTAKTMYCDLIGVSNDPVKIDEPVPLPGVISEDKDGAGCKLSSQHQQNFLKDHDPIRAAKTMHHGLIGVSSDPVKIVEAVPLPGLISEDEDGAGWKLSSQQQQNSLKDPADKPLTDNIPVSHSLEEKAPEKDGETQDSKVKMRNKGLYVGVKEDMTTENDNDQRHSDDFDLADIWNEMTFGLACSKDANMNPSLDENKREIEDDCDHQFVLKEDIGDVCRVCGVIGRAINTIIDFKYIKASRNRRTYWSVVEEKNNREVAKALGLGFNKSANDFGETEIFAHPRLRRLMKQHQVEGFNFLQSNLMADNPGGCILAHAPGSGKTFMMLCFLQSFLAKYPSAKPLVVLPKGILGTWKKEFQKWQVEDFPLYDFYSAKAERRSQQLDVLKNWVEDKSILFLGYKQFSAIVMDQGNDPTTKECRTILLEVPSILILDEGHASRNEDTNIFWSLGLVKTPRKVVLSGTIFQNHVREVFNVLNLVRPKFSKLDRTLQVVKRIMSRTHISGARKLSKLGAETAFYDLVEETLQSDDLKRKVAVIRDLREMTSKVLHYYKGDFLEDLPGLVDFTVFLNPSASQRCEIEGLRKLEQQLTKSSVRSAVYVHPHLKCLEDNKAVSDDDLDAILDKLVIQDGVKMKFFLRMIELCEAAGEKLLVFSQFLLPLRFLERLVVKVRGWSLGKETFMFTGKLSNDHRELSMEQFNNSPDAKIFFGSIKACGEGISLVGASRILILDVPLNPSITRQAIGRAFRPGQQKKVYAYRLIAADSPEEEEHNICHRKDLISKMWFEWQEHRSHKEFQVECVDVNECGDDCLESSKSELGQDVKALYRR